MWFENFLESICHNEEHDVGFSIVLSAVNPILNIVLYLVSSGTWYKCVWAGCCQSTVVFLECNFIAVFMVEILTCRDLVDALEYGNTQTILVASDIICFISRHFYHLLCSDTLWNKLGLVEFEKTW